MELKLLRETVSQPTYELRQAHTLTTFFCGSKGWYIAAVFKLVVDPIHWPLGHVTGKIWARNKIHLSLPWETPFPHVTRFSVNYNKRYLIRVWTGWVIFNQNYCINLFLLFLHFVLFSFVNFFYYLFSFHFLHISLFRFVFAVFFSFCFISFRTL